MLSKLLTGILEAYDGGQTSLSVRLKLKEAQHFQK